MGKLGIPKSDEPLDWCGWPLAVPMVIISAVGSKLIVGPFFYKYNPLAPESTSAVWLLWLSCLRNLKGGGGLRLTVGEGLFALKLFILISIFSMSAAPPCHKLLFQFGGRLLTFFPNSKQVYILWKPSFLQCGHVLGMRLSAAVLIVLLRRFVPNFL